MTESKKDKYIQKLKNKYILAVYNETTFIEVFKLRLSRLNVFVTIGITSIILIALTSLIIAYTPLREYIPGYPDSNMRISMINNAAKLDSLEHALKQYEQFTGVLHQIINGKVPESRSAGMDTAVKYDNIEFTRSIEDSLLRKQIEEEDQFNLSITEDSEAPVKFSQLHFFAPIQGSVTRKFDPLANHYGTDIVTGGNKIVSATLSGTVVMANWTLATGYVIQIQHDNNLISIYKHNAELLKEVGSHVEAGESIAIVGNSGELTTGPHLHFEIWHNGNPVNPEKYILF
jgi:murein DD-endopeptidase MepM/ murein hydrolase activator NlpD